MSEWQRAHLTETYKSLITTSVEALKIMALVNSGAASPSRQPPPLSSGRSPCGHSLKRHLCRSV
jgi:hypothetical protein